MSGAKIIRGLEQALEHASRPDIDTSTEAVEKYIADKWLPSHAEALLRALAAERDAKAEWIAERQRIWRLAREAYNAFSTLDMEDAAELAKSNLKDISTAVRVANPIRAKASEAPAMVEKAVSELGCSTQGGSDESN